MELKINGSSLTLFKGNDFVTNLKLDSNILYDDERQWFEVTTGEEMQVNSEYTMSVPYSGKIIEKLVGFYRGEYTENGKTI